MFWAAGGGAAGAGAGCAATGEGEGCALGDGEGVDVGDGVAATTGLDDSLIWADSGLLSQAHTTIRRARVENVSPSFPSTATHYARSC